MVELREHQKKALEAISERLSQGVHRQLVALPTGGGKTILAAVLAEQFTHTLFLVHQRELLRQSVSTFERLYGKNKTGIIWDKEDQRSKRYVVSTVQTIQGKLSTISPKAFDLVILDEAHHAQAKQFRTVLDHFEPVLRLGLSATPERADGAPLSNLFDEISYQISIWDGIESGILSPFKAFRVHTNIDLNLTARQGGDFSDEELGRLVDTPERNTLVINTYISQASGKKALAFTAGIDHAKHLSEIAKRKGILSEAVWGSDPQRDQKIGDFKEGKIKLLANSNLLLEGFDDPSVEVILMTRPTESKPLYVQSLGRGLRTYPGKSLTLVFDFVDNSKRHGSITTWSLAQDEPERAGQLILGIPNSHESSAESMRVLAEKLHNQFMEQGIDYAIDFLIEEIKILRPPPVIDPWNPGSKEWHYIPASPKQLEILKSAGYEVEETDWARGQASIVIGQLPATSKQLSLLLALGYDTVTRSWTRDQAEAILTKLVNVSPNWERANRLTLKPGKFQRPAKR